jgi:hypothetical protein
MERGVAKGAMRLDVVVVLREHHLSQACCAVRAMLVPLLDMSA